VDLLRAVDLLRIRCRNVRHLFSKMVNFTKLCMACCTACRRRNPPQIKLGGVWSITNWCRSWSVCRKLADMVYFRWGHWQGFVQTTAYLVITSRRAFTSLCNHQSVSLSLLIDAHPAVSAITSPIFNPPGGALRH